MTHAASHPVLSPIQDDTTLARWTEACRAAPPPSWTWDMVLRAIQTATDDPDQAELSLHLMTMVVESAPLMSPTQTIRQLLMIGSYLLPQTHGSSAATQ